MYELYGKGPFFFAKRSSGKRRTIGIIFVKEIEEPFRVGYGLNIGPFAIGLCKYKDSLESVLGREVHYTVEEIREWVKPEYDDDDYGINLTGSMQ